MSDSTPNLSPWAVGDLATQARDLPRQVHPEYGTPLAEVMERWGEGAEWLEAAVLAGYAPYLDGIELVVRAHIEQTRSMITEAELERPLGDALGLASVVDHYREIVGLLEWAITDLERWTAELLRRDLLDQGVDPVRVRRHPQVTQAAQRAKRARLRRVSAQNDTRLAKDARGF